MAKKIYDIRPSKTARETRGDIKEFLDNNKNKRRVFKKPRKNFPWPPLLSVCGIVVLLVLVYLFFKLPKAEIKIWPKTDVLSYQQTITIDKSAGSIDPGNSVIPAKLMEEEVSDSKQFSATGNASDEGKAQGIITVYNKYDPPTSITLKVGTHFLSDSGKYFVSLQKIIIPAAKKSGGKTTPGSVNATVEAAEGGDSYNIAPAKFSVPKLAGTNYYYAIYAESLQNMSGGYAGKIKKVTADDIQSAKDQLTSQLISNAENSLKQKISSQSDYFLLDSALYSEITDAGADVKAGITADNFNYQAKVKVSALVFKKSDIEKFAKDYIISQMSDLKTMLDSSLSLNYTLKSMDIKNGTGEVDLSFSAKIYQSIDKNSFSLLLEGKDESRIIQTINEKLGGQIEKAEIKLWPFWVTKSPNSQKAIKIDLEFE